MCFMYVCLNACGRVRLLMGVTYCSWACLIACGCGQSPASLFHSDGKSSKANYLHILADL